MLKEKGKEGFCLSDLSVLAYANNFTLWHYVTDDETISEAGYFNDARDMVWPNDLIIANVNIDKEPVCEFYVVISIDTVDVKIQPMYKKEN